VGCITWLIFFVGAVLVIASVIRWFEQTAEAVDAGWWNKLAILVLMPFTVWLFPSRVSAGRATPVPRHEPVRGFGGGGTSGPSEPQVPRPVEDLPPPGTPVEFLGMPVIPKAKPKSPKPAVDPEKLAKLRQKMREQGMLPPDDST
jgi:hypothetical protein